MDNEDMKASFEKYGKRAKGRSEYKRFLEGESLTRRQAIMAYCYECQGFGDSLVGSALCSNPLCPLYEYSPFKEEE